MEVTEYGEVPVGADHDVFNVGKGVEDASEGELPEDSGKRLRNFQAPQRVPEWDILIIEQVHRIEDPVLRAKILECKNFCARMRVAKMCVKWY